MPTDEYRDVLYPKFGVQNYHDRGLYGQGVSIYVIDIGLSNLSYKNVKSRTITNAMAPKNTHGSFVTSILATPRSAQKIERHEPIGIVPEAQLYIADASDADGLVFTSSLVAAIHDAIELNVDIISISMGTSVYDASLEKAVNTASKQGILVLAAAGNCGCRAYEFPSSCASAISVGSIDINRQKSPFNTRNDFVSVFAPGQNIGVPGSKTRLSGTSFAVPFASGLLALELSRKRIATEGLAIKGPATDKGLAGPATDKGLAGPATDKGLATKGLKTLNRLEAINFLRTTLGLSCDDHNYANQVCTGELAPPPGHDALLWFLVLALTSGVLILLVRPASRPFWATAAAPSAS